VQIEIPAVKVGERDLGFYQGLALMLLKNHGQIRIMGFGRHTGKALILMDWLRNNYGVKVKMKEARSLKRKVIGLEIEVRRG